MASPDTSEGFATFAAPGISEPCQTYYKVFGQLPSNKPPLIVLHGGPGATHDYLLPLADLCASGITVIFYDQIGNGKSTHLRYMNQHQNFWIPKLFLDELDNLLAHLNLTNTQLDIYGHSWGAMLAIEWAAWQPRHLRKLVLANGLASIEKWAAGLEQLRVKLPQDVQEALRRGEANQDFTSEEYQGAMNVFFSRHLCLRQPWPCEQSQAMFAALGDDYTVYGTMYGPSELVITGTLRDWDCIPKLDQINAPTLLINGDQDLAQDVAVEPFFDHISKVRWVQFNNSGHFSYADQRDKHVRLLLDFLQ